MSGTVTPAASASAPSGVVASSASALAAVITATIKSLSDAEIAAVGAIPFPNIIA